MSTPIYIEKSSRIPKYIQISESIMESIKTGTLEKGAKLPSINQICSNNQLARETVVKAFQQLKEKGVIDSVHGKGFYVSSTNTNTINRIFLLFDTFTSYKETLFYAIKKAFGPNTILDIYFHHFNYEVFKNTIATHIGTYTSYIVLPMSHREVAAALKPIPTDKLYLLDIKPDVLKKEYNGIFQDFEKDINLTFSTIQDRIAMYNSLKLVFRNTITDPPKTLKKGFRAYCKANKVPHKVTYEKVSGDIQKGEAFIVIDDNDLVSIVEAAKKQHLKIGKDIGIISYNDTPLKKVVANGISVISTDFSMMGSGIVEMILKGKRGAIRNKTTFVDRASF